MDIFYEYLATYLKIWKDTGVFCIKFLTKFHKTFFPFKSSSSFYGFISLLDIPRFVDFCIPPQSAFNITI